MRKKVFCSETEMQQWLSRLLHKETDTALADLILNAADYGSETVFDGLDWKSNKIIESYKWCLESLYTNEIIVENENISLEEQEILKPDFLLFAPETSSLVCIELKNEKNATRQVGTELGAYIGEIRSQLPFFSEGEIVFVIISTSWPTLLKHYVVNEIIWLNRHIICLEPTIDDEENERLRILDLSEIYAKKYDILIGEKHLGGYHVGLYDHKHDLRTKEKLLRNILQLMADKGERLHGHGFAFLWKNSVEQSSAPYVITIVDISSFSLIDNHSSHAVPNSNMMEKYQHIINEYDPYSQGQSVDCLYTFVRNIVKDICSPNIEHAMTWDILIREMDEQNETIIAYASWGIFREIFTEKLIANVHLEDFDVEMDSPIIGFDSIYEIVDRNYELIQHYRELGYSESDIRTYLLDMDSHPHF